MMRRLLAFASLVVGLALLPPAVAATNGLPKPLAGGLEQLATLTGFSCHFSQTVYFSDGSEKSYAGTLAIRRPGRFRWQYTAPYAQLFVSDGNGIWHYEPDLMQANRMASLDAVDPVAMKLLDGRVQRSDVHLLGTEGSGAERAFHVRIGDGPELWLSFGPTGRLHWLESRDALGNRNRITLSAIDFSTPAAAIFNFVPPEGVDVIGDVGSRPE